MIGFAPRGVLRTDLQLDPADSDQRILLEVLACGVPDQKCLFVSGDMQPVADAQTIGLRACLVPEGWLRSPEPSPQHRRLQQLERELADIKRSEPTLEIELAFLSDTTSPMLAVKPWTEVRQQKALAQLIGRHTRPANSPKSIGLGFNMSDMDSRADYDGHRNSIAPATIRTMPRWLQEQYGQRAFRLVLHNAGAVPALRLKIDLHASSGWISERPIWFDIDPAPRKWDALHYPSYGSDPKRSHYGPHDFFPESPADRRGSVSWSCEDFRHGYEWTFKGYVCFDPSDEEPPELSVVVTAANFHGRCERKLVLVAAKQEVEIEELLDLEKGRHRVDPPFFNLMQEVAPEELIDLFDFIDPERADG